MKFNKNILLAIVGTSIFLVGITFGAIGSIARSAVGIDSKISKASVVDRAARETHIYFGFVEVRSSDSSDGHFQAHIGLRNPFE